MMVINKSVNALAIYWNPLVLTDLETKSRVLLVGDQYKPEYKTKTFKKWSKTSLEYCNTTNNTLTVLSKCPGFWTMMSCFVAIQTALRLRAEGKISLHQELKLSRRKQRETLQRSQNHQSSHSEPTEVEAPQHSSPEQQGESERLEQHIEGIIQVTHGGLGQKRNVRNSMLPY